MAWAWSRTGFPYRLLTRIGDDDPDLFTTFLDRHGVARLPASLIGSGPSASIDIAIRADRQPFMDHFVAGVWDDLRLTDEEEAALARAERLHVVLVEGAIAELERQAGAGHLDHVQVAADFLGFRHYTVERFAADDGDRRHRVRRMAGRRRATRPSPASATSPSVTEDWSS